MLLNSAIKTISFLEIKPSTPSFYIRCGIIAVLAAALAYFLILKFNVKKK